VKVYFSIAALVATSVLLLLLFVAPEMVGSFLNENLPNWYSDLTVAEQNRAELIGKLVLPILAIAPVALFAYFSNFKRRHGLHRLR
jgi:hypothetical protein